MCIGCYASYSHSGSRFLLLDTDSVGYWQHIAESFSRNCPWPCSFYLLPGGSLYPLTGWCSPFVLIQVNLEESLQLYSSLWDQLKPLSQFHHSCSSTFSLHPFLSQRHYSLKHSQLITWGLISISVPVSPEEPNHRRIANQNLSWYFLPWQNHLRHHLKYQDSFYIWKRRLMEITFLKLC